MLLSMVNIPAQASDVKGGIIYWDGNGSTNLPCPFGALWILAPGPDIISATLTVNGNNFSMTKFGNNWKGESSGSIDSNVVAFATFTGELSNGTKLTISHCLEGISTETPTDVPPTNTQTNTPPPDETPTLTPTSEDPTPTPTETEVPTPTPTDTEVPTPTPTDTVVPTPTPEDPTPTPVTPTPEAPTPTPVTPTPEDPTPTPSDPGTTPTPSDPGTTPTPSDPGTTPTPDLPEETPTPGDPTATPGTGETPDPTPQPTLPPPTSNDPPTILIPVTGMEIGNHSPIDKVQSVMFNMGLGFLGLGLVLQSLRKKLNF
jgi:hypothetical protein